MADTIEVKESINETYNCLAEICEQYKSLMRYMEISKDLLSEDMWTGAAKDKCTQINTLLSEYCEQINSSIIELTNDVGLLYHKSYSFYNNSDCIRILNSI